MAEMLSGVLMVVGAAFILLASLGVLRMPDLFIRMSSSTKAATLGVGSILLSAAVFFGDLGVTSRAMATIAFLFLTAPVAAHMIGRAGYFVGVQLSQKTVLDQLHGRYDLRTHRLAEAENRKVRRAGSEQFAMNEEIIEEKG